MQDLAVCCYDLDRQQVVAGETVPAHQATHSAAQRQSRDTRIRCGTERRREPDVLHLAIELTQQGATASPSHFALRVDLDVLHPGQIDHQPAVAARLPGQAVASAANRSQ